MPPDDTLPGSTPADSETSTTERRPIEDVAADPGQTAGELERRGRGVAKLTGDIHAVSAAHNLLAALLDAHRHHGNALSIDPDRVAWPRARRQRPGAERDGGRPRRRRQRPAPRGRRRHHRRLGADGRPLSGDRRR